MVLVRVGSRVFGLEVDKLFDTEAIVVKPVTPILRGVGVLSGNTILGDGSVVMIVDLNGLAGMLDATRGENERCAAVEEPVDENDRHSLLIF